MADAPPQPALHPTDHLVGKAPTVTSLRAQIRHLAGFDTVGNPHVPTVLLQGETGTGKGLVARVMHDGGPRADGPFIEVNCAAIPETMLEAELFGFEPGAFTDAKRAKPGLFEAASAGTLFLDEIDALPLVLQGKLLTAIESKRVRRLGAVTERAVDVKLIAATNAVLPELAVAGRFRADLYHRLAVLVLVLPPLRERGEDICALAESFLQHYTAAHGVPSKRLSAEAEAWLQGYAWPGNVRELSHLMERVTLLHMGEEVDAAVLMQLCHPLKAPEVSATTVPVPRTLGGEPALPAEAEQIRLALVQTGGNVVQAARLLGLSRDTVRYRMQRYGIVRPRLGASSSVASTGSLGAGAGDSFPRSAELPPDPPLLGTPPRSEEGNHPQRSAARQDVGHDAAIERNAHTQEPAWEQKPVAVLALELTWPADSGVESLRYDPWTEVARWEQAVVDKVGGFGGALVQRSTSILVWVFGVPQVLEQLPQRAVHSALAIRQMVVEANSPNLIPHPKVRLAVNLGAVRIDTQGTDPTARLLPVGETLAQPVRLLKQAAPGEVLIASEVGRLVDGWVALEERPGPLSAGQSARAYGYAVIGVGPGREARVGRRTPTRSPFVGRERELELLSSVLEQVKAGRGQVLGLVGAPGMGKSRLLHEFRQRLAGQRIRYAEGQCLAYGSAIPYLPVLDLLRDHCGIAEGDAPEVLTAKMRLVLERSGDGLEAELPLLLELLGVPFAADPVVELSTDRRRARTFEALYRMFLASSRERPLVLTVDNLHWIDPTSEAFLAGLIERLESVPLLVLTTVRPGYHPPWGGRSSVMQLALAPLDPDASRQVVRRVLANRSLPPALEQQLLAKAQGNPFFLEELAHTVQEHEGRSAALVVPNTVQAVLATRIDRLPPEEKHLLRTAAVIGPVVPLTLLQAITELPVEALHHSLAHLQAAEFLYETRLFPEREYTFKHALTQEVAYGSLPQERRRALHACIVEALEALAGGQVAVPVERLAYHALQGEVWDSALAYGRQAGERAMMRSAYHEAVTYLEQALGALTHLPESRNTIEQAIDLRLALGSTLRPSGDFGRSMVYSREVESLAAALDDPRRLGEVSLHLSYHFYIMSAYDQAIAAAQRAIALATACRDAILHAQANIYLSVAYRALGNYRGAISCLGQSVASLEGERRSEQFGRVFLPAVHSRVYLTTCHAELGSFAEGKDFGEEGLRIAEAVGHTASLMIASWGGGMLALRQGSLPRALLLLERAMGICLDADIPLWFPWIAAALGAAYTLGKRHADAVRLLTQAAEQSTATDIAAFQTFRSLSLGEAHIAVGRLEEAHTLAERTLAVAHERIEWGHKAYALRLLGDIAANRNLPEVEQAEIHYRQSLALADKLGMQPLQAHCRRSLGTLYRKTGRHAQARSELLAALTLYRTMEMTFWLPETEAALAPLQGDDAQ